MRSLIIANAALISDPRRPPRTGQGATLLALAPSELWDERGEDQPWARSCPAATHTLWHRGDDDPRDRAQTVADWAQRNVGSFGEREEAGVHHRAIVWVDVDVAVDEPLLRAELPVPVLALAWPRERDVSSIIPAAWDALRALAVVS